MFRATRKSYTVLPYASHLTHAARGELDYTTWRDKRGKKNSAAMRKAVRSLQNQLVLISVISTLMVGLGRSEHPCARYSEATESVNSSANHCQVASWNIRLICTGGLDHRWKNGSDSVRILTLCGWREPSFDPEEISIKFPRLKNLSVYNGSLTRLSAAFPSTAQHLQNVTFSGTKLNQLAHRAFSMLPVLRVLDLRNNDLSIVDSSALAARSIRRVHLSGNPWKCASRMSWILNLTGDPVASRIVDRDKLICTVLDDSIFSEKWLGYDRPLVPVVEVIEELRKQCLKTERCSCELSYVGRSPGTAQWQLMAFVTVNCSSRNFTEMPEFLPKNTTTLYLSRNQIRDLSPLKTNPFYKGVQDVYLDYNEVESIAILEGSDWLDQFRALSLRGNRLTDLPPYALENALQRNRGAASVFLGENPWRCDCLFTPGFQDLLGRHTSLFKDTQDIACSRVDNDENSGKQIIHLTRTAICTLPTDWIQPLDVLNIVLASLIFFVFGKLLYDYWTFKRTGKLPWLVAKIP